MEYKTCKITLVNNGSSDSVIKVYPAEHSEEKIWMNSRGGIERWESIKRILYSYAPRGQYVPEPALYHQDSKDLAVPSITEDQIPMVTLEGHVLAPLPPEAPAKDVKKEFEKSEADRRFESIEAGQKALNQAVALLLQRLGGQDAREQERPVLAHPGAKQEAPAPIAESSERVPCPDCPGQTFKNEWALGMHRGRMHKKQEA